MAASTAAALRAHARRPDGTPPRALTASGNANPVARPPRPPVRPVRASLPHAGWRSGGAPRPVGASCVIMGRAARRGGAPVRRPPGRERAGGTRPCSVRTRRTDKRTSWSVPAVGGRAPPRPCPPA
ncbi:hypothetical protein F8144_34580, partial [Streptomyces triticiradicis]